MQVRIIVEDTAEKGWVAEHGLAIWIEAGGKRLLFDTGQGPALEANAAALGLDLGLAEAIVLSHGHYDHTGGLSLVLERATNADVYFGPGIDRVRYAFKAGSAKQAGMPPASREGLDRIPRSRLHEVRRPVFIAGDIGVTGPIPRETSYEDTGGPFYLDPEGRCPDPIDDDLALWIRRDDGLVVFVGCAHAGLVNTLNRIRALNDGLRIRAVIGGFHLGEAGPDRLSQTLAALRTAELDMVVPLHCTGLTAVTALRDAFGERVRLGSAGTILEI